MLRDAKRIWIYRYLTFDYEPLSQAHIVFNEFGLKDKNITFYRKNQTKTIETIWT